MAAQVKKHKELTGRHVMGLVVAFFGIIIAVNAYFLFAAVTSFRGEDVKRSYRQGLEYNQTIASRKQQKALGWTASANFIQTDTQAGNLIVAFRDANNQPIDGLSLQGVLRHPTNLTEDEKLSFKSQGDGRYVARTGPVVGVRQLRALAFKGGDEFRFQFDLP